MAQQPSGGDSGGAGANDMMWLVAFITAAVILLWMTRDYYFPYIFALKIYELKLVGLFYHVNPQLLNNLFEAGADPSILEWKTFLELLDRTGGYYNIPVAIITTLLSGLLYFNSASSRFCRSYSMRDLAEAEKVNWPQITPVTQIDLIKIPIEQGEWASAVNPMNFAKINKLLDIIENPNPSPLAGEINRVAKVREERARQLFAQQMGPLWEGIDVLPPHRRALLAIFMALANEDRKSAEQLLLQFNTSLENGKIPNFAGVDAIVKKHQNSKLFKQAEKCHAYVLTLMATLLELARTDGVLATASFLWLKPIDRTLWYMLNNVGRRAAFAEVAGPVAHWKIEKRIQRKLITPMVEEAVTALKVAVTEVLYQDDQEK
jgi:intracellular multiplication protein IcmP